VVGLLNLMADSTLDSNLLCLETQNTRLEPLTLEDVEFLFELRRGLRSVFMKPISPHLNDQYIYFRKYLEKFTEGTEIYYKIIDKSTGIRAGVVRLTEIDKEETFCWESLVTTAETRAIVAIDTFCLIYRAGFEILQRKFCSPFTVPKLNKRVIKLHEMMEMVDRVGEVGDYWLYQVTNEKYKSGIVRMIRLGFGVLND